MKISILEYDVPALHSREHSRIFFGFSLIPQFITTPTEEISSVVLEYAYIETLTPKYARFRFGIFKFPFSLEAVYSDKLYEFNERSLGTINFIRSFDLGLMAYGSFFNGRFVYGFGIFNGNGRYLANNSQTQFSQRMGCMGSCSTL